MKVDRKLLARRGLLSALRVRRETGIGPVSPLSIHDIVEKHGVEVWHCGIPSLEGFYCASPGPMIILNAMRPEGRKAFTCAHEFGHHIFGHGNKVDTDGVGLYSNDADEFLVDCFAGFLLMPRVAICNAFLARGWDFRRPTSIQVYSIACLFGVGYTTLIHHMKASINLLDKTTAEGLADVHLQSIHEELGGRSGCSIVPVDDQWIGRPVELVVGDQILATMSADAEGECLSGPIEGKHGLLYEAARPGVGRLISRKGEWTSFVRVAKREYVGRSSYRFLEDPDAK